MIAASHLSFWRGQNEILRDVSFRAHPGALTVIAGPNGAGKSTLLQALAGLLPDVPRPDPCRVAYLAQGARAAWGLSVKEVAMLGRIPFGDRAEGPVVRALALCGVTRFAATRIDHLSGGEARRAMLARVFAGEPEVLLLDEPTADLDPSAAFAIVRLLRETAVSGRTVIVVLHAVELALRYAHRLVVMEHGQIIADGSPRESFPAAARAFGLAYGADDLPHLLPK